MGVGKSKAPHGKNTPESNGRRKPAGKSANGAHGARNSLHPIRFTIDSDLAKIRSIQARILRDVVKCGYDEQSQFAINLALEEAMINAIKHGNKLNPSKKVHVEAKVSPRRSVIVVEDQGPGFDRHSVPDPRMDENLCKCSGRGILLMEAYMNSVSWTKHGRRVKMVRVNQRHLPA